MILVSMNVKGNQNERVLSRCGNMLLTARKNVDTIQVRFIEG